jgi:type II secretion system protein C
VSSYVCEVFLMVFLSKYQFIILRTILSALCFFVTSAATAAEPKRNAEDFPLSNLDLRVVSTDGTAQVAILEQTKNNEQSIFETGDRVFGATKLVKILDDSVIVRNNGRLELVLKTRGRIGLNNQLREQAPEIQQNVYEEAPLAAESVIADAGIADLDPGNEVLLARDDINKIWSDVPRQLMAAVPLPVIRDWEIVGISLSRVEQGSLLEAVGLNEGDILKTIDGVRIADPMDAWSHINQIDGSEVKLKVERGGEDVELTVRVS